MTVPFLTLTALLLSQQPSDEMARRQDAALDSMRASVERMRNQRDLAVRALRDIQTEEVLQLCSNCVEGLHAHSILLLADRALGTKHACTVPREWLERQR